MITESVFQWPGMGLMFIQAVQNADIPIMSAYLMLVAFMFVIINFIVDLIYARVDPRIRIDAKRRALMHDAPTADSPPPLRSRDCARPSRLSRGRRQRQRSVASFLRSKLASWPRC